LKVLQPTEPDAKEGMPLSDDRSFVEPKATGKPLRMRILDPGHQPEWDQLVALHRDADCFHTGAWAKVLAQSYGHRPFYFHFSWGDRLAALIPLMEVRSPFTGCRGVCLPFSDVCEPLIFEPEALGLIRERLLHFAQQRRWTHLEIRGGKSFQPTAGRSTKFWAHTLTLRSEPEQLLARFASSVRRAIRKAERSGVSAMAVHTRQSVGDFYQLHVQTRRRHGLPPQPASFFSNIYEQIIKPGLGFTVLAQRGHRRIAAAIFFHFGKNALYKYGASENRFQEFRANNLVIWQGIQFLACQGAERIHFGRTDCENDGLRRFKLSWGTEEQALNYFRVDPFGREYAARHDSAFHKRIFCRLPLAFNRLAGSMIYPHLD
jgi:hypothetical protein